MAGVRGGPLPLPVTPMDTGPEPARRSWAGRLAGPGWSQGRVQTVVPGVAGWQPRVVPVNCCGQRGRPGGAGSGGGLIGPLKSWTRPPGGLSWHGRWAEPPSEVSCPWGGRWGPGLREAGEWGRRAEGVCGRGEPGAAGSQTPGTQASAWTDPPVISSLGLGPPGQGGPRGRHPVPSTPASHSLSGLLRRKPPAGSAAARQALRGRRPGVVQGLHGTDELAVPVMDSLLLYTHP